MTSTMAVASSSRDPVIPAYSADLPLSHALPYFDREIETQPGLQARVEREIQLEMQAIAGEKGSSSSTATTGAVSEGRLPPLLTGQTLFADRPDLLQEVQRAGAGERMTSIDSTRFQLPPPTAGSKASEEEWNKAVDNAATQLLHQQGRLMNIELMKRYGANHWRLHNLQQQAFQSQYEAALEALTAQTTTLNRKRRQDQVTAGETISTLERRWTELISRALQLEVANISAEHEVQALELEEEKLRAEIAAMDA